MGTDPPIPGEGEMKFMILVHGNEKVEAARSEAETQRIMGGHMKFAGEMRAAGKMTGGDRLRPESEAVRLPPQGGQRQVTRRARCRDQGGAAGST